MTDLPDEMLLKKRARRRLLGAVIFALVVAVLLPFLMDENPNQKIDDVLVKIPPSPAESVPKIAREESEKNLPSPVEEIRENPPVENLVAPPKDEEDLPPPEGVMPLSKIETPPLPPAKEIPPVKQEVPTPNKKEILAQQRKAAEKEAQKNKAETERIAAILEGRDTPSTPWVIMIGTFSNLANVKNLTEKLKALNVPAFTENLPNQTVRVRAGPFSTQKSAENALTKMQSAGIDGKIIQAP